MGKTGKNLYGSSSSSSLRVEAKEKNQKCHTINVVGGTSIHPSEAGEVEKSCLTQQFPLSFKLALGRRWKEERMGRFCDTFGQ